MRKNRLIVFLAGFLFTMPVALTSYVNSSYLENFLSDYYVSAAYIAASLLVIFALMRMPRIMTYFGNRRTAIALCLLAFLSLILLAESANAAIAVSAFILFFLSANLIVASLDIFIEDFSRDAAVGRLRGIYLTIINIAWVAAQAISGSIIEQSSFRGIYLFSAIFMLFAAAVFFIFLRDFRDPEYRTPAFIKTLRFYARRPDLIRIYLASFILKFFFAWMIIYTPIYLHEYLLFSWSNIGFIFTIMLTPFVLLDFPLGKLSDKIGEKKLLLFGFALIALATLAIPLISTAVIFVWAGILFLTRVGAATIEIMSESYFFKAVNEEHADAISFYRNTSALSFIIGPLAAIICLAFIPSFQYLFFILAAILLVGFFLVLRLRDIK